MRREKIFGAYKFEMVVFLWQIDVRNQYYVMLLFFIRVCNVAIKGQMWFGVVNRR